MIRDGDKPCYACDVEREHGDRVDAHAQELPVRAGDQPPEIDGGGERSPSAVR